MTKRDVLAMLVGGNMAIVPVAWFTASLPLAILATAMLAVEVYRFWGFASKRTA